MLAIWYSGLIGRIKPNSMCGGESQILNADGVLINKFSMLMVS